MIPSPPRRTRGQRRARFAPGAARISPGGGMAPGSIAPGTDQEWGQALRSPALQQALQDPQIQQALLQNLQGQGGPQTAMPPQRFQAGGAAAAPDPLESQIEALQQQVQQLKQQQVMQAKTASTTSGGGTSPGGILGIGGPSSQSIMPTLQNILGVGGTSSLPLINNALGMGGNQNNMGGNQNNLGPATWGNTLGPMALAGALGAGSGPKGNDLSAALVGMGTAGLVNFLMRRKAKQQQQRDGDTSLPLGAVTTGPQPQADLSGLYGGDIGSALAGITPGSNLSLPDVGDEEFAQGGGVHADVKEDRAQTLGILKEKNLLKKARGGKAFATGGAEDIPEMPARKSKAVLLRKPLGHAVPVLSTTIVIGKKPAQKKKQGGAIKAAAVPPAKGPGQGASDNGTHPPAPYRKGGHVQVPRGSGAAIRGKRFGGIF